MKIDQSRQAEPSAPHSAITPSVQQRRKRQATSRADTLSRSSSSFALGTKKTLTFLTGAMATVGTAQAAGHPGTHSAALLDRARQCRTQDHQFSWAMSSVAPGHRNPIEDCSGVYTLGAALQNCLSVAAAQAGSVVAGPTVTGVRILDEGLNIGGIGMVECSYKCTIETCQ